MQTDKFPILPLPDLSRYTAPKTPGPRLRVCIATEEIVGPVRNGGIASTYYHLARLLVAEGHDVTVCYLKGRRVENKDVEHWIDWYGAMGVTFVPLPHVACDTPSMWQHRQYSFYRWLEDAAQPFDVVHVSEWRGGAYYALQARRLGLAFPDTLFLVKASSPHIWNRHYQMGFVNNAEVLAVMYPEQQSIELADMVIGGSAHLLRFMEHTGYTLPPDDTYVQPNVLLFDDVAVQDQRGPLEPGDRVHTQELTFFGRLEARKGLEIFCTALDYLVARGVVPERVSFVGKQGANMPTTPNRRNLDVIMARARNWPFPIDIHTGFDQPDVLAFLTAAPRIAVMPSLIENSTMAAYEALLYKVPFIATRTGGTPELIAPEDHADMLVEANPKSLADGLERVLKEGGKVGRCSFDNADNIATWVAFHEHLAGRKGDGTLTGIINRPAPDPAPDVSLILHADDDAAGLARVLKGARKSPGAGLADIVVAATRPTADILALADPDGAVPVRIVPAPEMTLGQAWNTAAGAATGAVLMFLRADIHHPLDGFAQTLSTAYATPGIAAAGTVWQREEPDDSGARKRTCVVPMGDDLAITALDYTHLSGRGVSIRAADFHVLGGFDPIFAMDGIAQDLLMRARDRGRVVVIPQMLYRETPDAARLQLNMANAQYMALNALMNTLDYPKKRLVHALNLRRAEADAAAAELAPTPAAPTPPIALLTPAQDSADLALTHLPATGGVLITAAAPLAGLQMTVDGGEPTPLPCTTDADGSAAYLNLPGLIGGKATWPRQIRLTAQTAGRALQREISTAMRAGGEITLSADAPGLQEQGHDARATPRLVSIQPQGVLTERTANAMRVTYDSLGLMLRLWSPMPRQTTLMVPGRDPVPVVWTQAPDGGQIAGLDLAPVLTGQDGPLTLTLGQGDTVFRTITLTPGPDGIWLLRSVPFGADPSPVAPLDAAETLTGHNVTRAAPGAMAGQDLALALDEKAMRLVLRRPADCAGQTVTVQTDQGAQKTLTLTAGPLAATASLDLAALGVPGVTGVAFHAGDSTGPVLRRLRLSPGPDNVLFVAADAGGLGTMNRAGQFPPAAARTPPAQALHNLSAPGPQATAGAPKLALRLVGTTLHMTTPATALTPVEVDVRGFGGGLTHVDLDWLGTPPARSTWRSIRRRLPGPLQAPLPRGALTGTLDLAPLLTTPATRSLTLQIRAPGLRARRIVQLHYDSDGMFYLVSPENVITTASG